MIFLRRRFLFALAVSIMAGIPSAQSNQAGSGLTMQGPAERSSASIIRDALGRPCLDIEAAARKETINPQILDHVISFKNNCPRIIHAKACYSNSDHCKNLVIPPYKRIDAILGSMRGVNFFRYTIEQK